MYKYQLPLKCPEVLGENERSGVFFRLSINETLSENEFTPILLTSPHIRYKNGKMKSPKELCKLAGVSVYLDIEDAILLSKSLPRLGNWVHSGNLDEQSRVIKKTGSNIRPSHRDWFPFINVDITSFFQGCAYVLD